MGFIYLHEATTMSFSFWTSLFLLLVILIGVYLFYRDRIRRVQKQKDLLESQVKQRTIEIIKQKEKVERQKKLLEEEKEKS